MNNTCYIIGAGDYFDSPSPSKDDFVITADGGYSSAISHGVRCDLLIGDLDSLKNEPKGVELMRHPVEKDETDTHLSYLEGVRRGYTDFAIYGGTGGSLDHTLANISLLLQARKNGHTMRLYGKGCVMLCLMNESYSFSGRVGARVSVFALGGEARGITLEGLKYSGQELTLTPEFALGVSNELALPRAIVSVADGAILLYIEK